MKYVSMKYECLLLVWAEYSLLNILGNLWYSTLLSSNCYYCCCLLF